jgi:hypothetical protein
VSPRHGDGGRTDGAGCRDTGGVGLGGSVTIASHGGHDRSGTGCWTHGGSLVWAGFSRARSAPATGGMGTSWACSERAATRPRRAGARFVGEAGRSCYGARRQRGWACCERPEEETRAALRAGGRGWGEDEAGARHAAQVGSGCHVDAAATTARLRTRGLHAGAMDLLRAAGRDGRTRSRRGKKNGATRGYKDAANAHDGRENGEGERGRGELTSADERRRSGGTWLRRRFDEVGGRDRGEKVGDERKKLRVGRLFFSEKSHGRFVLEEAQCFLRVGPAGWRRQALGAPRARAGRVGWAAAAAGGAALGLARSLGRQARAAAGLPRLGAGLGRGHARGGAGLAGRRALSRQSWAAARARLARASAGSWAERRAGPRGRELARWAERGEREGKRGARVGWPKWARGGGWATLPFSFSFLSLFYLF